MLSVGFTWILSSFGEGAEGKFIQLFMFVLGFEISSRRRRKSYSVLLGEAGGSGCLGEGAGAAAGGRDASKQSGELETSVETIFQKKMFLKKMCHEGPLEGIWRFIKSSFEVSESSHKMFPLWKEVLSTWLI